MRRWIVGLSLMIISAYSLSANANGIIYSQLSAKSKGCIACH